MTVQEVINYELSLMDRGHRTPDRAAANILWAVAAIELGAGNYSIAHRIVVSAANYCYDTAKAAGFAY